VFTFAEALHALVDLVPWREELHKLAAHNAIAAELESKVDGAHAGSADAPSEATTETSSGTATAAAGKADKSA
jgi:hypothetical protein